MPEGDFLLAPRTTNGLQTVWFKNQWAWLHVPDASNICSLIIGVTIIPIPYTRSLTAPWIWKQQRKAKENDFDLSTLMAKQRSL